MIGLTGAVGAGKSTVARILEGLGAAVIDSDGLCHEELAERSVVATLVEWWGSSILAADGGVDRSKVGRIVFDDPTQLTRLEGLLYPRIAHRRMMLCSRYESDPEVRAIVLDSPKLMEAGLDGLCDAVVFVEAGRSIRRERLRESRGWTDAELNRREKLQDSLDNKRAKADYILVNHSNISELCPSVEQFFASVLASFR